jgi:hypothetical protein
MAAIILSAAALSLLLRSKDRQLGTAQVGPIAFSEES